MGKYLVKKASLRQNHLEWEALQKMPILCIWQVGKMVAKQGSQRWYMAIIRAFMLINKTPTNRRTLYTIKPGKTLTPIAGTILSALFGIRMIRLAINHWITRFACYARMNWVEPNKYAIIEGYDKKFINAHRYFYFIRLL